VKKALLVNWDSYPNVTSGGVYSWEKVFVERLKEYEFTIVNLLSNPNVNGAFTVPPNVSAVIDIPLFGSNRYEEFYNEGKRSLVGKIVRTNDNTIEEQFLPAYNQFLDEVLSNECDPTSVANYVYALARILRIYDAKKCLEHTAVWESFIQRIDADPLYRDMTLREALTAFQIIQRNMQILSLRLPQTDIVHCSLAWLPAMIAICAKLEYGTPVMVTEHGVAFRELLLYYNAYLRDEPSNIFWKMFSSNIVRAVYAIADVIAPVCYANAKWETSLGVPPSKVKVIYNGVDVTKFRPLQVRRDSRPTVVCIGRVDIFKDILNLIHAINHVRRRYPDVQCLIYGASTDLEYSLRCLKAVETLDLEDTIKFMGKVRDPEVAYNASDVVVISSITEGFPFAIIEAMACGKGIVATDVGGNREALEGCGVLVRSSHPQELALAIIRLLSDPELRSRLGTDAVKQARAKFTIEKSLSQYREEYERLTLKQTTVSPNGGRAN
jgi:glycosyltransferase involved in cell wall biosynthesis